MRVVLAFATTLLFLIGTPGFSQMAVDDKKMLSEVLAGKDGLRFWSSTACDDLNVPTVKYVVDKEKPFVLYLKRLSYKGPPAQNGSNLFASGYTTIRKIGSGNSFVVISSDIFMIRAGSSSEEKASGTSRLFYRESPARMEVIDYFVGDRRVLKDGLWLDGPNAGKKLSASTSCN